jgi:hypothetical protein
VPYIAQQRRKQFDEAIDQVVAQLGNVPEKGKTRDEQAVGDLNYVIFSIVKKYLNIQGPSYSRLNAFMGVLTCCGLEIYRRLAIPYEIGAMKKNGDI